MDEVIFKILENYNCKTKTSYENALKEILQEIALLGLWRSKFFEHALFYGATALRILYKLDRFSEDLDFSLLRSNKSFNFSPYLKAMTEELKGFGFDVDCTLKEKNSKSNILSAFIKSGTQIHFMKARVPAIVLQQVPSSEVLKIKLELDTNPPHGFESEIKTLLQPIPFYVKSMKLEDLFAGKLHAVLARAWKQRVKGRDFYDFVWFIGQQTPCRLTHLHARLVQTGHWKSAKKLTNNDLKSLLKKKFQSVDFEQAKRDVAPFLKRSESVELWSESFFIELIESLKTC